MGCGICKQAQKYYKDEPLKKDQFTFTKVLSHIKTTHRNGDKIETKEPNKEIPEVK